MAAVNTSSSTTNGGASSASGSHATGNAGKTEWPQALKDFASRAFSASTNANRALVQEELRALIHKCYTEGKIHTTNWAEVELESLKMGKKKMQSHLNPQSPQQKKKRSALADSADVLSGQEKKEKRARRFDRDRAAYDEAERESLAAYNATSSSLTTNGSNSLAGRIAGIRPMMSIHQQQTQHAGWSSYDYSGQSGQGSSMGRGTAFTPNSGRLVNGMNASVFADADVADPNVIDWDQDTVVGLSTKLEKPYLRLTSAPDPFNVRTLATLRQTLELLKKKWRTEANYSYICDQFKSMRQDLTVQRIKNDFTVKVYEIHARIALEKGDLGEYNQCQSQLRGLYALGLPGSMMEFLAYRILYLLHTRNRREVNILMAELTPEAKAEPAVKHALAVRSALACNNFHAFFRLYDDAPNMNAYVIDHFIDRERVNALIVMSRCFRPSLALSFLTTELAFPDAGQTHDFLSKVHAAIYINPSQPAQKASSHATKGKIDKVSLEARNWNAKEAQSALEQAHRQYRTVDIKGQI